MEYKYKNDIAMAYGYVLAQLQEQGIPCRQVDRVTVNRRLSACFGRCKRINEGAFEIEICVGLANADSPVGLYATLAHELIHTCEGCFNHGELFNSYSAKVESMRPEWGRIGGTGSTVAEKHIEAVNPAKPRREKIPFYACVCPSCKGEFGKRYSNKNATSIKNAYFYKCSKCKVPLRGIDIRTGVFVDEYVRFEQIIMRKVATLSV